MYAYKCAVVNTEAPFAGTVRIPMKARRKNYIGKMMMMVKRNTEIYTIYNEIHKYINT